MLKIGKFKIILFSVLLLSFNSHSSNEENNKTGPTLKIGTMHSPPFAIKGVDGRWSGISIELWREIAKDSNFNYQFEEHTLQGLINGVKNETLDVAVAAITVTELRESVMDFTHPIHSTGFAIATVLKDDSNIWLTTFGKLLSWQFLKVVLTLFVLLFAVGWIMWLFEYKHQTKNDDSHTIRHVSEGFWWAAATMTTVGYGDKTPLTKFGRAFGVVWMFTALIIVASFIAAFSSILTLQNITSNVQGLRDLNHMSVATVPGSTSETFLHNNGIATQAFPTVKDSLAAVVRGDVDACVYDAPLLRYFAQIEFKGSIEVSSVTFERQDYGFALPENSQLREPINRVLLRVVRNERWREQLEYYLGK